MSEEKVIKKEEVEESNEKITKEQIEKLHEEIKAKEAQTLEGVKQDVAKVVKEEIKKETKLDKVVEESEKLAKQLEEQKIAEEEKLKSLKEEFNQKIEDLKNEKQSISTNENPFAIKDDNETVKKYPVDLNDIEVKKQIEEESQKVFIEKYGLDENFGRS